MPEPLGDNGCSPPNNEHRYSVERESKESVRVEPGLSEEYQSEGFASLPAPVALLARPPCYPLLQQPLRLYSASLGERVLSESSGRSRRNASAPRSQASDREAVRNGSGTLVALAHRTSFGSLRFTP